MKRPSDYTPSVEEIRNVFLDGAREWGEREHVVGAEFDRWLRSVKAAVWDEGFDFGHYAADWESRDCDCRKNPYREDS